MGVPVRAITYEWFRDPPESATIEMSATSASCTAGGLGQDDQAPPTSGVKVSETGIGLAPTISQIGRKLISDNTLRAAAISITSMNAPDIEKRLTGPVAFATVQANKSAARPCLHEHAQNR